MATKTRREQRGSPSDGPWWKVADIIDGGTAGAGARGRQHAERHGELSHLQEAAAAAARAPPRQHSSHMSLT